MNTRLTSDVLSEIRPLAGLTNAEQPVATVYLDCPDLRSAREVSGLLMDYQNGQRTFSAPLYFGDTGITVEALEDQRGGAFLAIYPRPLPGQLCLPFYLGGSVDPDGWDMFRTYFYARRQFFLSVSVDQKAPQELPTLVKYTLIYGKCSGGESRCTSPPT